MQTAQVIPFKFETREVRTMLLDEQPWFVAADVAAALGYPAAPQMTRNLDEDERGMQIVHTPGGEQEMLVINESGLYSAILRSRLAQAKRFKKWVTAELLPTIRRTGRYEDTSNKMATLVDEMIGMTEVNVLKGLIREKAKVVAIEKRRGFQLSMHNRLHTRFNVPRIELIPAQQFEAACNFIAAYALEGEWIEGKPEKIGNFSDLIGRQLSQVERWLVYTDANGAEQMMEVPMNAFITTHKRLVQGLMKPGELSFTGEELCELAQAALCSMKNKYDNQAELIGIYQKASKASANQINGKV